MSDLRCHGNGFESFIIVISNRVIQVVEKETNATPLEDNNTNNLVIWENTMLVYTLL